LLGRCWVTGVCFGSARAVGRGPAEALVGRSGLETADRWFARWGTVGIVATRLLPGVGFDAISFAAGLSRIRFQTSLAVTLVASAPQTLLYAFLGQRARERPGGCWPPASPSAPWPGS